MRVVLAGATGFIGTKLCTNLLAAGHEVTALTRTPARRQTGLPEGVRLAGWPEAVQAVDGSDALVNLAGENVAQRWSAAAKERIVASRLRAVEALHDAVARSGATRRPSVLVNASAVGYYGSHADEELDEESPPGDDFLAGLCVAWEAAARRLEELGLRVVRLRIGLVLGRGGALAKMLPPFKAFAGGPLGSGRQWVSWIHLDDLVGLILWALADPRVSGPLNATAPAPVRMRELATALGKALSRPSLVPVPAFVLKAVLGEMSGMLLDGQRVLPRRAQELGFPFRHRDVLGALHDLTR